MKSLSTIVALIGLAIIAFGLIRSVKDSMSPAGGKTAVAGTPAPDFTVRDLNGKSVSLKGFRGKVVVLDFWATWCQPCLVELPLLEEVAAAQDARRVAFMAVNVDVADAAELRRFVKLREVDLPVYVDEDNTAATRYRVKGLPTLVIIDPQGITRNRHVGLTSKEELLADISALTGRSARDL